MIDLHTHSTFSDGSLTPEKLVALAQEVGVTHMSLTDHDTLGGQARFMEAAAEAGIDTITGIELSAAHGEGEVHMLGYGYDPKNAFLIESLTRVRQARTDRNHQILKRLQSVGVSLEWSDIERAAGEEVIGRPHFAAALIRGGYVQDKHEAFEQYLGHDQLAYIPRARLSLQECIDVIHQAGGVAVLAHPLYMSRDQKAFVKLLEECGAYGLDGLEVYYNAYDEESVQRLKSYADSFNLLTTGGTDFHGTFTPGVELGRGRTGKLDVPTFVWERLQDCVHLRQNQIEVQS